MRSEKLGWTCIADEPKTAVLEIVVRKLHGSGVRIRFARDLTENPIAVLRCGKHYRRAAFGVREVRKGKRKENY